LAFNEEKLEERNYRPILIGMEKKEVIELVGEPKDFSKASPKFPAIPYFPGLARASIWKNDQLRIVIVFDSNSRVIWKRLDKALSPKIIDCQ
jgi:hypothetical protein